MTKLLTPLRLALALATVFTATGCELYFGGHNGHDGGDRWTYCGSDGYYVCSGDSCEWAGARCPSDPNYTCTSDKDCAAGCFCAANGTCEEAGFCGSDTDCPSGYHCDVARSSCEPNPPSTCQFEQDCQNGEVCDPTTGTCTPTCVCDTDAQAQAAGYGSCNETRHTCEPASAVGSCAGAVTCNIVAPTCAAGEVPLIANGCYTGTCNPIGTCDVAPGCKALQHESDCLGNTTCSSVYTGINCTKPDHSQCNAGDSNCTCESFQYASCTDRAAARQVVNSSTGVVDLATFLSH